MDFLALLSIVRCEHCSSVSKWSNIQIVNFDCRLFLKSCYQRWEVLSVNDMRYSGMPRNNTGFLYILDCWKLLLSNYLWLKCCFILDVCSVFIQKPDNYSVCLIFSLLIFVDHNTELDSWPLKFSKYATPVLHHTGQWTHDSWFWSSPKSVMCSFLNLQIHFSILKEATDSSHILVVLSNTCCLYSYLTHWRIIVILIKFMSKI